MRVYLCLSLSLLISVLSQPYMVGLYFPGRYKPVRLHAHLFIFSFLAQAHVQLISGQSGNSGVQDVLGFPEANLSRVLVIPKTAKDDTNWLRKELPELVTTVYSVHNDDAGLCSPVNKGHEAMVQKHAIGISG